MKIIVTGIRGFPHVQGGVENHCEKLYTQLVGKGCEVTVFTRTQYVQPDLDSYRGISLISISSPRSKYLEAYLHTLKSIFISYRMRPDILHIHAIGPSFFAPLARLLGMKVVVTNHGPDYRRKKWPLPAKLCLRFCEYMGMTFANEIIAISGNIAEDIKKKYNREVAIIPNGVDVQDLAVSEKYLKKYGLTKQKYILAVGRFVPEKGFDDLIDAFNSISISDWKLVIVGDADHEDKYSMKLKAKINMHNNIVMTGFLSGLSLKELYSHAGLFVIPSYYEGHPIALLEAMSYGLSCIASDIPANRNIEMDGNRFFPVGNVSSLSDKIRKFINQPWGDKDRKEQIKRIREKYSWEKIADETLKVYSKIV